MSRDKLRARALEDALRDPGKHFERLRAQDRALARIRDRATRRAKSLAVVGVASNIGGAALGVLTLAAVITTPLGWALAGGAAALGLGSLAFAATAKRKAAAASARHTSMRLGHGGRALETDTLLARIDALRDAIAGDYARYERRVLAEVDARRHVDNAALLQDLRARQLAHVARLDAARTAALALRQRLVERAITEEVDGRLERLEGARERWNDGRARQVFERDDLVQEIARLTLETDTLEQLERELA